MKNLTKVISLNICSWMTRNENAVNVQFDEKNMKNIGKPKQETPTVFPKSDIKPIIHFRRFIPPSKWPCEREIENCYHCLGEYRQLQIQQSISLEAFMSIIYLEFIGSPWEHIAHAREEFLKRKCCSFQKKDLEKHYNCKSQRFYYLNGVDDVNLKQVFLNSFPESFENEAYWAL
ncbi:hypothetical protein Tco_0378822 [Tanacetum coccineum]